MHTEGLIIVKNRVISLLNISPKTCRAITLSIPNSIRICVPQKSAAEISVTVFVVLLLVMQDPFCTQSEVRRTVHNQALVKCKPIGLATTNEFIRIDQRVSLIR